MSVELNIIEIGPMIGQRRNHGHTRWGKSSSQ